MQGAPADLDLGPGVVIRAIVSRTPRELVAEVDVASDAPLGKRSVVFHGSMLPGALAIYDRIDYVKVSPDSAVASFSDSAMPWSRMASSFSTIGCLSIAMTPQSKYADPAC